MSELSSTAIVQYLADNGKTTLEVFASHFNRACSDTRLNFLLHKLCDEKVIELGLSGYELRIEETSSPDKCYSLDQETFHSDFDDIAHQLDVGDTYYEADQVEPTVNPLTLGEAIKDQITETLFEEVGEACDYFTLSVEQQKELGQMVLDQIKQYGGYRCYGVTNVITKTATVDDLTEDKV